MSDLPDLAWYEWLVLVIYFSCLVFIFLYSLVQLNLVWRYTRKTESAPAEPTPESWPLVTVQLPLYNEKYVAERLIEAICGLDYPKDKLEIQVLDDSNDETIAIVDRATALYREQGFDIQSIRRSDRGGYKAGALAEATERAKGEYIAIFDADFVPVDTFLKRTVPHFQDEEVGAVQTRWEHLNRDYSLMTELQAFGLDAHFTVEQGGRFSSGCFINFNGTAGIWRKKCIEDAGGWSSDTLTEDLDLSYRAQLKGWNFVYREDIGSPAELPAAMNALKTQQYRWTKGAAECTVKNLKPVWKKKNISWYTKVNALFHLMNSFIFICVFLVALLSVAVLPIKASITWSDWILAGGSLFLLSMVFLMLFYWISFRRIHPQKNILQFFGRFFMFLSLSMGLSLHNAIAVAEGYLGRKTPFVRTPKFNIVSKSGSWRDNIYLHRKVTWLTLAELSLAAFFAYAIFLGFQLNDYGLMPFHSLLFLGFLMIGGWSLRESI